jgi:hypothetical protein
MSRLPLASFILSLAAVVIAFGGGGYTATGDNFILGRANMATTPTALVANINGRTLQLSNFSIGAAATPLALFAGSGRPPFTVNTATKVPFLNADRLDGLDSTQFGNRRAVPYNLASGAISAAIALPVTNRPVLLMAANLSANNQSLGQATLMRSSGLIVWTGLNSPLSSISSGSSNAAGTHIISIDRDKSVKVEVNDGNTIRINNAFGFAQSGVLTFIW